MRPLELLQFPYSHFNEKARWALDFKRVPHRRRSLLPGPHALTVYRLTGQTAVPVVRFGDGIVAGSARIIDELEKRHPDPPLYPADLALRTRALDIQARFDERVGPMVRRGLFSVLLDEPAYVCRMFASEHDPLTRALYRASFPLVRGRMRSAMGITDRASIEEAVAATEEALELVASQAGPNGYLIGDRFSVADLTAAALLAPIASPPDSPMARPEPVPEPVTRYVERWSAHPGVAWVLEQYRCHRSPRAPAP